MSKINKSTLHIALGILNTQRKHAEEMNDKVQEAYYKGMRNMLEIIISDAYAKNNYIANNDSGAHAAIYENGELIVEENFARIGE